MTLVWTKRRQRKRRHVICLSTDYVFDVPLHKLLIERDESGGANCDRIGGRKIHSTSENKCKSDISDKR